MKDSLTLSEVAEFLGGTLRGSGEIEISGVAALDTAQNNQIAFLENEKGFEAAATSQAACLLISEELAFETGLPTIAVKNPKLAFARIAEKFHPPRLKPAQKHSLASIAASAEIAPTASIDALATIEENSRIGAGTQISAGARIGANVTIGDHCLIYPNCVVYDNSRIGNNVIIHSGAIIGADGFGFVRDGAAGYVKFPQIGVVVIEDNVEIGANTCIDRGALGETRIGEGTKIDNLVQIAHNVRIGKRVVIAAQTGISGSSVIEDDCVIGGQVGIGDHATVKSGAIVGSQAGILPGKIVREGVWWGTPVQPLSEYKRQNAMVKGLSRLREEIKTIKKLIGIEE